MSPASCCSTTGSAHHKAAIAATPKPLMPQKAARQPACSPTQAASGTPPILASVRPMNIVATALARRFGGTTPIATTEPTPKKAPWLSDVITRATSSMP